MDSRTLEYYDRHAADVSAGYRGAIPDVHQRRFEDSFERGSRIMDVGAGSGRDLALLLSLGFDAYGMEPSAGMRDEALKAYPELASRILPLGLPLPENAATGDKYDGVVCSAVLMHVPEAELFNSVFSLKRLLREGGRLLLSFSCTRPGLNEEYRDEHGRLFTACFPEFLLGIFERLGFQLRQRWENADSLGRPGMTWHTLLLELNAVAGRPLELIERVMNRDLKVATYKLALLRALSEIATQHYHQAKWISDDSVAVPARLIAEKWFCYYWPIFESADFIPQNNGESPACKKPVAFRRQQSQIVQSYRQSGGLPQFLNDESAGRLAGQFFRDYQATLRCIQNTIKEGPVVYASGKMFRYDKCRQAVVLTAGAWREFCRFGHWIEPAVTLRWAEETSRMSNGEIETGRILSLLVSRATNERDVETAKVVFDGLKKKECIWSAKALMGPFAVDHVIPFSLWHCNELWNLMPCDARVNLGKSDQLPRRELLFRRRDQLVHYWERLRERHENRFTREVVRFTGRQNLSGNWQGAAFDSLVEAIEVTAAQRGAERWSP